MKNILQEIYQQKLIEVRGRKKLLSGEEICKKIKEQNFKNRDFFAAVKSKNERNETVLICEVKKASPSRGIIRENFDAVEIAKAYEKSGAACISVLTDEKYFMGSDQYLQEVRANVDLPLLRKDFVVDVYQVWEAKMLGADCILLILAMIDDEKAAECEKCALSLGMSVLIEVHDEEELHRALRLKSKLIGINNRNLKTLQVDIQTSFDLMKLVPKDYVLVVESGILNKADLLKFKAQGINCFLIGEYFMRQDDIGAAVVDFVS